MNFAPEKLQSDSLMLEPLRYSFSHKVFLPKLTYERETGTIILHNIPNSFYKMSEYIITSLSPFSENKLYLH